VDAAWEQYKLEARKMAENGGESHLPALGVGQALSINVLFKASL
jgi:hypothetical protein